MSDLVIQPEDLQKIINKNNLKIFDCRFNLLKKELVMKIILIHI